MTYDDGILVIYSVGNAAAPGDKPVMQLTKKSRHYYGFEELGITRYYQAKSANQQIACVVRIPGWEDIKGTDICALDDGTQYQIRMVQPTTDDTGLHMMKITLERVKQDYEVP